MADMAFLLNGGRPRGSWPSEATAGKRKGRRGCPTAPRWRCLKSGLCVVVAARQRGACSAIPPLSLAKLPRRPKPTRLEPRPSFALLIPGHCAASARIIVGGIAGIDAFWPLQAFRNHRPGPMNWIFRPSIRRKIVGIAVALIVLMVLTSLLSVFMAGTVGRLLAELNDKYFPAYAHLAQA